MASKLTFALILGLIFLVSTISLVSAGLCRDGDGYYHACLNSPSTGKVKTLYSAGSNYGSSYSGYSYNTQKRLSTVSNLPSSNSQSNVVFNHRYKGNPDEPNPAVKTKKATLTNFPKVTSRRVSQPMRFGGMGYGLGMGYLGYGYGGYGLGGAYGGYSPYSSYGNYGYGIYGSGYGYSSGYGYGSLGSAYGYGGYSPYTGGYGGFGGYNSYVGGQVIADYPGSLNSMYY